jgi:hypothetical protein
MKRGYVNKISRVGMIHALRHVTKQRNDHERYESVHQIDSKVFPPGGGHD